MTAKPKGTHEVWCFRLPLLTYEPKTQSSGNEQQKINWTENAIGNVSSENYSIHATSSEWQYFVVGWHNNGMNLKHRGNRSCQRMLPKMGAHRRQLYTLYMQYRPFFRWWRRRRRSSYYETYNFLGAPILMSLIRMERIAQSRVAT